MTNTNCLENIACPKCGNDSLIHIEVTMPAAVTDDGAETFGDMYWDHGSFAKCPDCGHSATLGDFHTETALNEKGI